MLKIRVLMIDFFWRFFILSRGSDENDAKREQIIAEYFGDTPQEELRRLAVEQTEVEVAVWFSVRNYEGRDGEARQFQNCTLQSISIALWCVR